MENEQKRIRIKTLCLITHNGKMLVCDRNSLKGTKDNRPLIPSNSYRLIGGTLNFNEPAEQGIRREVLEELGSDVENLQLLNVFEDMFVYHDAEGHDIVFLFKADLVDTSLYEKEVIHIDEETYEFDAVWIPISEILDGTRELHPRHDFSKYLNASSNI